MRRVLCVAYLYPPAGGGGVQRTTGFVRHLPRSGWQPTVLCGRPRSYWAEDASLGWDLQAETLRVGDGAWAWTRRAARAAIRRVAPTALPRFDAACVPDDRVGWWIPAVATALRRLRVDRHHAIYASGPPWTALCVGATVARRTGLPLIADFRDPWSQNPLQPPERWTLPAHRALEAFVVDSAHACIQTSAGYAARMSGRYPRSRILHVPNGFEERDFADLETTPVHVARLGYAGSYYGVHRPDGLFDLLGQLPAATRERLSIEMFGNVGDVGHPGVDIRAEGYLPHRQALARLAACGGLFCTVPRVPGAEGCVPQKLYVYLRLGRPVLWWGPEGDAAEILRRNSPRHCILTGADGMDLPRLARWLDGLTPDPVRGAGLELYDRRATAQRLAAVLDEAVEVSV